MWLCISVHAQRGQRRTRVSCSVTLCLILREGSDQPSPQAGAAGPRATSHRPFIEELVFGLRPHSYTASTVTHQAIFPTNVRVRLFQTSGEEDGTVSRAFNLTP